jgi:hypothetical protein
MTWKTQPVQDPNVAVLAPTRGKTAYAASQQFLFVPVALGFFVGLFATGGFGGRVNDSSHVALSIGILVGVVTLALLLWRASGINLTIDRGRQTLRIRNLFQSYVVPANEVSRVHEEMEVLGRRRYRGPIKAPCLKVDTNGGRTMWIQASLNNGDDTSLRNALSAYCEQNGIRLDLGPASTFG